MKDIRITLKFFEWELIPVFTKPTYRSYSFRWLFIDAHLLLTKKK